MILIVDNYDSFTYNLVQYVGIINNKIKIIKNDEIAKLQIDMDRYSHIILSPGPGNPDDAGICKDIINQYQSKIPILGICLGMQVIADNYNLKISNAKTIMHGKTSLITHNNKSVLFNDIPLKFNATRYHSLSINKINQNKNIQITSYSDDGEIMSIEHQKYHLYGVQFHPESILTEYGQTLMNNFLKIVV